MATDYSNIRPRLTPLPDGWWLAVNPTHKPNVGVIAADVEAVRVAFREALERRERLLAAVDVPQETDDE